jgi:hypothetical protein
LGAAVEGATSGEEPVLTQTERVDSPKKELSGMQVGSSTMGVLVQIPVQSFEEYRRCSP